MGVDSTDHTKPSPSGVYYGITGITVTVHLIENVTTHYGDSITVTVHSIETIVDDGAG